MHRWWLDAEGSRAHPSSSTGDPKGMLISGVTWESLSAWSWALAFWWISGDGSSVSPVPSSPC